LPITAANEDRLMMRPQRLLIIGISSGCVTLKNPFSVTSITLVHCSGRIPGITASSCIPALFTMIWMAPSASKLSSAALVAWASVMSKATAAAAPPLAMIFFGELPGMLKIFIRMHDHLAAITGKLTTHRRTDGTAAARYQCAFHDMAPVASLLAFPVASRPASSTTMARPASQFPVACMNAERISHSVISGHQLFRLDL